MDAKERGNTMRLTRLSISNYKGFKEFEINFDSDINVMYGVNGVGKSTIIRAITALLQLINTKNGVVRNLKIVKPEDYHDITHDVKLTIYANIDN
ncbi:MAG: ATP-binding protein, partial [Acetobacterium sp.]|nr:ATP-binding protein [Acetobacterium sp.]